MNVRLLTDTCAAIKLLIFGEKLFQKGALPSGNLILHPRVFNETARWESNRKLQFKAELETMAKIKATTGLRPPPSDFRIK